MLTIRELIKTLYNAFSQRMKKYRGNWEQNDPTADDYIKNRPFYTDGLKEVVLVDNYTGSGNHPTCNFVVGQAYNVTWNGTLYKNVICKEEDGYNALMGDDYPFYIDDDGGNGFYVGGEFSSVSISIIEENIKKLDKKFIDLPDGIITEDDLASVATSGNYNDLNNLPTIYTDVVRYNTTQSLTIAQKLTGKTNIGAVGYEEQILTDAQKQQARTNIGAVNSYSELSGLPIIPNIYYNEEPDYTWDKKGSYSFFHSYSSWYKYYYYKISDDYFDLDLDLKVRTKIEHSNGHLSYATVKVSKSEDGNCYYIGGTSVADAIVVKQAGNYNFKNNMGETVSIKIPNSGIYFCRMYFNSGSSQYTEYTTELYLPKQKFFNLMAKDDGYLYTISESGTTINIGEIDATLSQTNKAAEAKAVGDAISELEAKVPEWAKAETKPTYTPEEIGAEAVGIADTLVSTHNTSPEAHNDIRELVIAPKHEIAFIDQVNGYTYIACMRDGNFVTYCATKSIKIATMPIKTEYVVGEYFDPTGMIVVATYYDGATKEITDYTYPITYLTEGVTSVEITYVEGGMTHTATVPVIVIPFDPAVVLVDFEYTTNEDGTYTITSWKGTLSGETSTELIVPNNGLIIV